MASARFPAGPSGPGHFRSAERYSSASSPLDPLSPAARQQPPQTARPADSSSILEILRAESWEQLKWLALAVLGPASHELGICYGLAEGGWGIIAGLLDVLKMLVLEGLYQHAHRSWQWGLLDLPDYLAGRAADYLMHSQLEAAHLQYEALKAQFALVLKDPRAFFGGIWNAEVQAHTEKWNRYKWLLGHRTLANEFQAGRIEGQVLLEVILLLATVVDGVGLALKGAKALGEIPELMRLARSVRSAREAEAVLAARRLEAARAGAAGEAEASAEARQAGRTQPGSSDPAFAPRPALRSKAGVLGRSEGGPGIWDESPTRTRGQAYQEQISGVERGAEYNVNGTWFDGYDAQRNVLLDAEDWERYPPLGQDFWQDGTLNEATRQLNAAGGTPIEWHFSTQPAADAVRDLFADRGIEGINVVVTPK